MYALLCVSDLRAFVPFIFGAICVRIASHDDAVSLQTNAAEDAVGVLTATVDRSNSVWLFINEDLSYVYCMACSNIKGNKFKKKINFLAHVMLLPSWVHDTCTIGYILPFSVLKII